MNEVSLIDKDALVAEIKEHIELYDSLTSYGEGRKDEANSILSFINSLKVKEVDLEKEIEKYLLTNATFLIGGNSKLVVHRIVKHFFELGMSVSNKAQKGE